ncbi:MAG: PKD domain-containing protein [Chloroflexota bacterium]|nr:PKD domain-containing protein [Chloroflexota bacterium]
MLACLLAGPAHAAGDAETTRVSVAGGGGEGTSGGSSPSISADGRYVAFESSSPNLVPGDTNNAVDVFVGDRRSGTTTRVSVGTRGAQGDSNSFSPSLSADGRYVAFVSSASNLVPGDTNGRDDLFVHDRQTATTSRVSLTSLGAETSGDASEPSISGSGRFVAFVSDGDDLAPGDSNEASDVFVRDREAGDTSRVSVSSSGAESAYGSSSPSISADGRFVAFVSDASGLLDRSGPDSGADASHSDIFVRDREAGTTSRVSVSSTGRGGNDYSFSPAISADGRFVAFVSFASNLVKGDANGTTDVFVHDRATGATSRVSVSSAGTDPNGPSAIVAPSISADGRYVAFASHASNLVPADANGTADVFLHDRQSGATDRVNLDAAGAEANAESSQASLSAAGHAVAFDSLASNLVSSDTNGASDTFVRETNLPPVVDAGSDVAIDEGGTFARRGSFSDPNGADSWVATVDYGDGSAEQRSTVAAPGFALEHAYVESGSYTIAVSVSDTHLAEGEDAVAVTVRNVAPYAAFLAPGAVPRGAVFSISFSQPWDRSGADTAAGFTYAFDCGDGSGFTSAGPSNAATCTGAGPGQIVRGRISDKDGGTREYTHVLTVPNGARPGRIGSLEVPAATQPR